VRPKILSRREAARADGNDNAVVASSTPDTRRVVLTAAVVLMLILEAALVRYPRRGHYGGGATIVLATLALAALATSKRWPTFAAVGATMLTTALLGANTPIVIVPFCAMLVAVAWLVIRRGWVFAAPLLVPFAINTVSPFDGAGGSLASATPLLSLLGALFVGEAMRKRGQAVAELDATQEAMAENERARTVMEERARIARELHDIVAHHLSVITVESEAARLTSPKLSDDAASRFESIASTAREALTETRRLLGVLREENATGADRTPQPGIAELENLIERAQATGTSVRFVRQGKVASLAMSVDLAAYRIVQEALTNARRHAPGANVDIEVSYGQRELHLHVRDYGPEASNGAAVEGHGLMGMRERATLAHGTFSAGPAEGGGFEVHATLPIAETTP
jgi:signal transduction histidine kinase